MFRLLRHLVLALFFEVELYEKKQHIMVVVN